MGEDRTKVEVIAVDLVSNLRDVGQNLNTLLRAINEADGYNQLLSVTDITEIVLEKQIEDLNLWLGKLANALADTKKFPNAEIFEPIET